jgi:hypothetical protein
MKRLLVLALLCVPALAIAQPVPVTWRPPTTCSTNDFLKWNGTVWVCGTVTSFSTLNAIPKGDGSGMVASSITDNGSSVFTTLSGYFGLDTGTNSKVFNVGRDTTLTTNAQNGFSITTYSDGNQYVDSKTITNGHTIYRFGSGAQSGAASTWLDLNHNGGATTATFPWLFSADVQLGDASTDRIGIGTSVSADAVVTFAAAVGDKIHLYPVNSTSAYGFGIQSQELQAFIPTSGDHIAFGVGDSGAMSTKMRVDGTGAMFVGDTAVTAMENNLDALTIGNTGTGQTSDTDLIDLSHSGSVSAAGAARTTVGIRSTMTTSVTDYTNEVTTIAGRFESAGITDTNYGIQAIATSPSGCGAPCTSLGITTAVALYANTTGGGINYAAIFENGMVAIGDTVFIGQDKAAADDGDETLYIESDATGLAFDYTALSTNAAVTLDATAAARASFGVFGGSYAARSAGANDVTNYGLYGDASGGQFNYALYTEDGGVYLNSSSGTTGIGAAPVSTTKLLVSFASSSASFIENNSALTIRDQADASGVGGGIEFQGNYNGAGTPTAAALCKAMKTNGTAGNFSFDFVCGTRPHGGNLTEVLRLYDGVAALGAKITGNLEVTAAINGYTQITQAADQDVTNGGLTDSNTLTISVAAGKIYAIDAMIIAGGNNTTGDYIFDFAVAAGTMDCTGTELSVTTADAIQSTTIIATAAADTADTSVGTRADASLPIAIRISLACKVSNTTTLKYRFGNAAASAGRTSRTMAGSFIKYKQLN